MPLDPRRILAAVLVASLGTLGALPHVAEALSGIALPPLGSPLSRNEAAGCRVIDVVDGDTLTLVCPGRRAERARLVGFDTPELFSPGCAGELVSAGRAKRHLSHLVVGAGHHGVVRHGRDRYGRALVALSVDGRPVAREMISAGLARAYDGGRRGGWCGGGQLQKTERAPRRSGCAWTADHRAGGGAGNPLGLSQTASGGRACSASS